VCYSTCSFNPIENEAVVCAALVGCRMAQDESNKAKARFKTENTLQNQDQEEAGRALMCSGGVGTDQDEYEVIPAFTYTPLSSSSPSSSPSGLNERPGLTSWRVPLLAANKSSNEYGKGGGAKATFSRKWGPAATDSAAATDEDADGAAAAASEGEERGWWARELECYLQIKELAKTTTTSEPQQRATAAASADTATPGPQRWLPAGLKRSMFPATGAYARLNGQLANCARLLPHLGNDGGGFFVALIRRNHEKTTTAASTKTTSTMSVTTTSAQNEQSSSSGSSSSGNGDSSGGGVGVNCYADGSRGKGSRGRRQKRWDGSGEIGDSAKDDVDGRAVGKGNGEERGFRLLEASPPPQTSKASTTTSNVNDDGVCDSAWEELSSFYGLSRSLLVAKGGGGVGGGGGDIRQQQQQQQQQPRRSFFHLTFLYQHLR